MHLSELLHKTFEDKLPQVHKIRLKSLMTICEAAISNNQLFLTSLGRALSNPNKESSNIQKVDRLLGNGHLQANHKGSDQNINLINNRLLTKPPCIRALKAVFKGKMTTN